MKITNQNGTEINGEVVEVWKPHFEETIQPVEVFKTKRGLKEVVRVVLSGSPSALEMHTNVTETLTCERGTGSIYTYEIYRGKEAEEKIIDFVPGMKVTIRPWTIHGVKPQKPGGRVIFIRECTPPLKSDDIHLDQRGRGW